MAYLRFPATDLCRFLGRNEQTAMYSELLRRRMRSLEAAEKDASGTRRGPEAAFRMDLRADFQWPQLEAGGKQRDDRRGSIGADRGEDRILDGSDPTLRGLAAAQRLRRRGSLPPKLSSRIACSVAGTVACREHNNFESVAAEEMKRWP